MSDVTTSQDQGRRPRASPATETPKFEIPRFDMPKFEVPKMEVPAAFREFAEKSVTQAKDNWEKMKAATEEATDLIEDSYATASKGAADYGLKLIEVSRANTNSMFDFATQLMTVKSLSEAVELSTSHMRKQFDDAQRAGQGAHRAGPEGHDRDRRADQGKRHQRLQEGRLIELRLPRICGDAACKARASGPGFFMSGSAGRADGSAVSGRGTEPLGRSGATHAEARARAAPCQGRPLHLVSRRIATACAGVAQLVRALVCGTRGRWFKSTLLYHPVRGPA